MRRALRESIPSMFQRRLLLLTAAGLGVAVLLAAQTARLATGEKAERLAALEQRLVRTKLVPTVRGRVVWVDARGETVTLAEDAPGFDVAVQYAVLSGEWAYEEAGLAARRAAGDQWYQLSVDARRLAIERAEPRYVAQVQRMLDDVAAITGTDAVELRDRIDAIRRKMQRSKERLWEIWRQREERRRGTAVSTFEVAKPLAIELDSHVIVHDVSPAALDEVRRRVAAAALSPEASVWEQVEVARPKLRLYPQAAQTVTLDRSTFPSFARSDEPLVLEARGVLLHLVGQLRRTIGEDVEARPLVRTATGDRPMDLGGYSDHDDRVGAFGVEAAAEGVLRGDRGQTITRIDTGEKHQTPGRPGGDVRLSVDPALQAHVQSLLDPRAGLAVLRPWYDTPMVDRGGVNQPLNGAAVVLEVETGRVIAAAGWPTPSLADVRDRLPELYQDRVDFTMVNRPFTRALEPGSTVKPLLYAMAATAGALDEQDHIDCPGFLDLDGDGAWDASSPREPRCWIYHNYKIGHGSLDGRGAIRHSCNTYFYDLGRRVGAATLSDWYTLLGFGRATGVGLREESGGRLPGPRSARTLPMMEGVYMAIGQGRFTATPMQVANAYATLARGGVSWTPTIYVDGPFEAERERVDLGLDPTAVRVALQGMDDVVHHGSGTARALEVRGEREDLWNTRGLSFIGKSGTAQTSPQLEAFDDDGDGNVDRYGSVLREGNNGWFVTLVKGEDDTRWRYVVVVAIEHGGGGGMTAAPINNQIHHALQRHGYLPAPEEGP